MSSEIVFTFALKSKPADLPLQGCHGLRELAGAVVFCGVSDI
jgi:hypothetical protein